MLKIKSYSIITVLFLIANFSFAQKDKVTNLRDFDQHDIHFGFLLAYNSADFYMDTKTNFYYNDSLISIQNFRQPGFNLGIIGSWNINKNIHIRLLPDLSFQDRLLEYSFLKNDTSVKVERKRVESTFLNFPILLKLRTNRLNNFAAYAIGGYQFGIDMASQKDVNNAGANTIVKIKRFDSALQVGGGVDFFLPYFKLGFELKLSRGINNMLIQDNTTYAYPINSLRSRVWIFSITFEG